MVTGATGFVGRSLVELLEKSGHEVAVYSRGVNDNGRDVFHRRGSVVEPATLSRAVKDIDAIVHLAAMTRLRQSLVEPVQAWEANLGGTLNMIRALQDSSDPKPIVLTSTGAIYGRSASGTLDEETPPNPDSPYAASKYASELVLRDFAATGGCGATVLRAFNIAGASRSGAVDRDESRVIPKLLSLQFSGSGRFGMNGDGSVVRDFVHVKDVAEAILSAVSSCTVGSFSLYNVGSGRPTTMREVVDTVERITRKPVAVDFNPAVQEPQLLVANISKIERELNWQPSSSTLAQIVSDAWAGLHSNAE